MAFLVEALTDAQTQAAAGERSGLRTELWRASVSAGGSGSHDPPDVDQVVGDDAKPVAAASTMRARDTNAAGSERERAIVESCACSASLSTSSAIGRPIGMAVSPITKIPKTDARHMPVINGTAH